MLNTVVEEIASFIPLVMNGFADAAFGLYWYFAQGDGEGRPVHPEVNEQTREIPPDGDRILDEESEPEETLNEQRLLKIEGQLGVIEMQLLRVGILAPQESEPVETLNEKRLLKIEGQLSVTEMQTSNGSRFHKTEQQLSKIEMQMKRILVHHNNLDRNMRYLETSMMEARYRLDYMEILLTRIDNILRQLSPKIMGLYLRDDCNMLN